MESESSSLEKFSDITIDFQEREDGQILLGPFVLSEKFEDRAYGEACLKVSVPEEEVQKWFVLSDIYSDSIRWDGEDFFILVNDSYVFNRDHGDRPMYRSSVSLLTPYSDLRVLQDDDKEPTFNLSLKSAFEIKNRAEVENRQIWHNYKTMGVGSMVERHPNYEGNHNLNKFSLIEFPFEEMHLRIRLERGQEGEYIVNILDSSGEVYDKIPGIKLIPDENGKIFRYGRDNKKTFFEDEESYKVFLEEFNRLSPIPGIKDIMITYDGSVSLDMVI